MLVDTSVWADHFRNTNADLAASLDRGEGIPGEQVFAEIESRLARLEQEKTGASGDRV